MPIMLVVTAGGAIEGDRPHLDRAPDSAAEFRWNWMAADVVVVATFLGLHWKAVRSRYDLRYLPPSAFRALMALAEVLVLREDREIAPAEVAGRVDHYLASFRAREKWKIRLALHRPRPTGRCSRCGRRSTSCRSTCASAGCSAASSTRSRDRLVPALVRTLRQGMIRAAQQFCFIGYYGDERAARKAGYVPFSRRDRVREAMERVRRRAAAASRAWTPRTSPARTLTADVVVVGTGAARRDARLRARRARARGADARARRPRRPARLHRGRGRRSSRTCTPTAR